MHFVLYISHSGVFFFVSTISAGCWLGVEIIHDEVQNQYVGRWLDGTDSSAFDNWSTDTTDSGRVKKDPRFDHTCALLVVSTRKWIGAAPNRCESINLPVVCISGMFCF